MDPNTILPEEAPHPSAAPLNPDAVAPMRAGRGRPRTVTPAAEPRQPARTRMRQRPGSIDKFHVPRELIPPGMTYEWKRMSTYGASDPGYDQAILENGWEPVPAKRHPQFMSPGTRGEHAIVRDGLMLMERPDELTREARMEDIQLARDLVRSKEAQLGQTPPDQLDRRVQKLGRSYEPIPIPDA